MVDVKLQRSSKPGKKYMVTFVKESGRDKTIHFGAAGMSDYTKHKDAARKQRYIDRHKDNEDWSASGVESAGWWSRWLLWSEPSMTAAKAVVRRKLPSNYRLIG